jgi:hypothetical protein
LTVTTPSLNGERGGGFLHDKAKLNGGFNGRAAHGNPQAALQGL